MVIYTDIKPLIVAGFVLVLINSSNGHPLAHQRKARDSGSYGRMTMLKKSCLDPVGNIGICMFKWDCISQRGITLSTCVDGFLFGACCSLKEDVQDKLTFDNYFKPGTDGDNEKSNTISLMKYATLSYVDRKTKAPAPDEEVLITKFTLPSSSGEDSEGFQDGTNTDSVDIFTSPKSLFSENVTINIISSENFLETTLDSSTNSSNILLINNETVNDNVLNAEGLDNQKTTQLNLEKEFMNFELKSNITIGNVEADSSSVSELLKIVDHTNAEIPSNESEKNIDTLSTYFESDFHEIAQPNPKTETVVTTDSSKLENKASEITTQIMHNHSISNEENFNGEQNYGKENISFNSTKDVKNSTVKETSPLTLEHPTSLLPPSFQVLISQLTSREVSDMEISVLPTLQTNLSSGNFNASEGENSELLFLNDTADILQTSESENIQKLYLNGNDHFSLVYNEKNSTSLETVPSTYQTHMESLTVSESPSVNTNSGNISGINLYTGIVYDSTSVNEEHKATSVSGKDETASITTAFESTVKYTKSSEEFLNNYAEKESQIPCDENEDLKPENSKTHYTSSVTLQDNKLYTYSDDNVDYKEKTTHNLNSATFDLNLVSLDKSSENHDVERVTTLSFNPSTFQSHIKEIPSSVTVQSIGTEINNDKNNIDYKQTAEESEETDILDPMASISSPFINDEFLFDITTDILSYFTKPEVKSPDFSEPNEPNFIFTTNELEESFSIQAAEENLITPSQIYTQQTHASTFEGTIDEIVNNLSSLNSVFLSTGNYGEKSPVNILATGNTTQNDFDGEHIISDLASTKTSFNINLNTLHENDSDGTSVSNESHLNFIENFSNDLNTSIDVDYENSVKNPFNRTESKLTSLNNSHQEPTTILTTSSATLNLWQNTTNMYNEITSNPSVNMSIPLTTDNSSSITDTTNINHHTTILSQNVDISNTTESSKPVFNIHSASTNGSYSATAVFSSSFSPVSSKRPSTISKITPIEISQTPVINKVWNYKKDCGVRPMQPVGRIVGGRNTYFGKWPWQALVKEATWLGLFVKNKCGGVLITSKYVLTAAHCQPGFLASLLVVLGTHDIGNLKDNGYPVIRNVKRMVVHRHYNPQTFENDLALLEMDTELEFMPHVVPICLPHRNEDFTGEMAFVTGWGKLTHGGDVPNILQEVQVPIVANSECQMMFYQAGHQKAIQNNFVCAGYTNGGQDSCEGDSGGPLMVQRKDKRWVLVGTVSHGIGCADPNLPGVYMRMSSYRPWIDSIINK